MSNETSSRRCRSWRPALVCIAAVCLFSFAPAGLASTDQHPVGAVYTQTNNPAGNAVVVFDRYADGTLAYRQTVPTGGNGTGQIVGCGPGCPILDSQNEVVVSQDGRLVFAVNGGSNTVSSFRETPSGLTWVSTVSSGGTTPESLALNNNLLYVLNVATQNANGTTGNVYGFNVGPGGYLTPNGSSQPLANAALPDRSADPRALGFDRTGHVLVATELIGGALAGGPPGAIDTFVIGPGGQAGPVQAFPSQDLFPFGFDFDNKNHLIVSNIHDLTQLPTTSASVSSYTVTDGGQVIPINTLPTNAFAACWVAVSNDGKQAFVVNTGAGLPAPITEYGVSAQGVLSAGPATQSLPGEGFRTDAKFSRDGKFLYVLSPQLVPVFAPSHIDAYAVNQDGTLTLVGQTSTPIGIGASGVAAS